MTAFNANEPSEEVCIFGFWHDFNNFERPDQEMALLQTLECLPTVLLMRAFLLREPNNKLLSWARMNYSLVTLLYWVIAINNSGLVQDDSVPNVKNEDEKVSASTRISGLHQAYMQFRFVRGSLDFGKDFNSALRRFYPQSQRPSDDCTFFACNLNPFEEWSKVLKNGLKSTKRMVRIAGDQRGAVTFSQRVPITTDLALCQPALIVNEVFRVSIWLLPRCCHVTKWLYSKGSGHSRCCIPSEPPPSAKLFTAVTSPRCQDISDMLLRTSD